MDSTVCLHPPRRRHLEKHPPGLCPLPLGLYSICLNPLLHLLASSDCFKNVFLNMSVFLMSFVTPEGTKRNDKEFETAQCNISNICEEDNDLFV